MLNLHEHGLRLGASVNVDETTRQEQQAQAYAQKGQILQFRILQGCIQTCKSETVKSTVGANKYDSIMEHGAKVIIHADLDAFYASVEQRDHPEWRGKPIIIGGEGKRGVVSTASYEARAFGVHSAQPGAIAKRLCPQGIFVQPRMRAYVAASKSVFAIFKSYTPLVEGLSLDEAFLDVTQSIRLFGSPRLIAEDIRRRVQEEVGLKISVGIASSKYMAKVASDLEKPDGLVEVTKGDELRFLAPLPLSNLWGAGPKTQAKLKTLGIELIGDLHRLSLADLKKILGPKSGSHFFHLSRGVDPRDVIAHRGVKSISRETTFGDDLRCDETLRRIMLQLAEDVGRQLRQQELLGATVKIKLREPDFTTHVRQMTLAKPTSSDLVIHRNACQLIKNLRQKNDPVRLIGVGVGSLQEPDQQQQLSLFEKDEPCNSERILNTLDEIRRKFGKQAIAHGIFRREARYEANPGEDEE